MGYDNSNSGFIGKNDRKTEDKHPDIKGSAEVGGVEYWVSGWKNAKGYGLRFTPKEEKPAPKKDAGTVADMDSDVPW